MTLDELLALLPDNTTGEIEAADLRTIVSDLWYLARSGGSSFLYQYDTTPPVANGKIALVGGWTMAATTMQVSEQTVDGLTPTWGLVDAALAAKIAVRTADGASFQADIVGPSVDAGVYRELTITPTLASGTPPSNNENVTVTLITVV